MYTSNPHMRIRPLFPLDKISQLSEIYGPTTLNIFSDASTRSTATVSAAAYGVVGVCMDSIVDSVARIHTQTDAQAEELRGVKTALAMACKFRNVFPNINIFSDSDYSISGLRDKTTYMVFNPDIHTYYTKSGNPVKNMELIAESLYLLEDLMRTNNINLYHIKGHMNVDGNEARHARSVAIGASTFKRQNNIPNSKKIDLNLIRYCGAYNGVVDSLSRSLLYRTNIVEQEFSDAVYFELDHDVFFN